MYIFRRSQKLLKAGNNFGCIFEFQSKKPLFSKGRGLRFENLWGQGTTMRVLRLVQSGILSQLEQTKDNWHMRHHRAKIRRRNSTLEENIDVRVTPLSFGANLVTIFYI